MKNKRNLFLIAFFISFNFISFKTQASVKTKDSNVKTKEVKTSKVNKTIDFMLIKEKIKVLKDEINALSIESYNNKLSLEVKTLDILNNRFLSSRARSLNLSIALSHFNSKNELLKQKLRKAEQALFKLALEYKVLSKQ